MSTVTPTVAYILVAFACAAAVTDLRERRIPNWLVVLGTLAGLLVNTIFFGSAGALASGQGIGLALLLSVPMFALRAMGGGDVKLMAAIGALVGPQHWLTIFVLSCMLRATAALVLISLRGSSHQVFVNIGYILGELLRFRLPYRGRPELDSAHPQALTLPQAVPVLAGVLLFIYAV